MVPEGLKGRGGNIFERFKDETNIKEKKVPFHCRNKKNN